MNVEQLREICISVKGATESFPFLDKSILVFKVVDKMFAYVNLAPKDGSFRVSLKCNPERSAELRERYDGVISGEHTHGMLWNAVYLDKDVPDDIIEELVMHAVDEVIAKLSKKKQEEYRKQ
ncbi:MAG: MmcQ/YjbR family DNA-binding protein [Dysgonomonas sp.]|nr:MmcQ/YjbR family DNA-binding protein [Dysgonomonas sp.]